MFGPDFLLKISFFYFAGSEVKSARPAGWGAILTAHKVTDAGVDNVNDGDNIAVAPGFYLANNVKLLVK